MCNTTRKHQHPTPTASVSCTASGGMYCHSNGLPYGLYPHCKHQCCAGGCHNRTKPGLQLSWCHSGKSAAAHASRTCTRLRVHQAIKVSLPVTAADMEFPQLQQGRLKNASYCWCCQEHQHAHNRGTCHIKGTSWRHQALAPGPMSTSWVTPSGMKVPQAMIKLPAAVRPSSSGISPPWSRAANTRACKQQQGSI